MIKYQNFKKTLYILFILTFSLLLLCSCSLSSKEKFVDNNSFSSDGIERTIHSDEQGFSLNFKKFKGNVELAKTNIAIPTSVNISLKLNNSPQKVKLILITPNNKIEEIINFENFDISTQNMVLKLENGLNKIKIISENHYDIDFEFCHDKKIFSYNHDFPFSDLFKDNSL